MNIRPLQALRNLGITTKFILWFLLISLVPLSISIYISYKSARKALKEEVANSLLAIADDKANQIEGFILTQKQNVIALSFMPEIISALAMSGDASSKGGADYDAVIQECRSILQHYQRLFGYDDIFVVNHDGDIIFSAEGVKSQKSLYESALVKKNALADVFIKARDSQDAEVSNFEYYPLDKRAVIFIASPIFKENTLIGLAIGQMSNQNLYSFVQDYTSLGNTGETILVSKIDGQAVFITPLRFDTEEVSQEGIKGDWPDIQKALEGESGSSISRDYRGKEVLVVRRFLPTFRLGMLVKMDTAEVFASADKLRNKLLGISLGLLVLVVAMALIIAYSMSRPIKELTKISKIISAGDLAPRAVILSDDEIGELATSFNQMTNNLVTSMTSLEEKKIELEKKNKELLELDNLKSDFLNAVSHDLRTPLTTIRDVISQTQEGLLGETTPEQKKFLSICLEDVDRLRRMIDNLLDVARLGAGKFKISRNGADIVQIARSAMQLFYAQSKTKNLELREKMPDEKAIAYVDRDSIIRVFTNLIGNAFKFTESGIIEVSVKDGVEFVECSVSDSGKGISEEDLSKVFAKFQQFGSNYSRQDKGTGLGLSICKGIIDLHKGKIWLESTLNKGTKFTFNLPKSPAEESK
ncbi:MAG: hypothetical protein A3K83_02515 [Omnitrophica WOR_2 bacterium RBG_13_44_8b]|nr:MAG: hypothetical protein A3K83_02515 [Omnitrophica WOR_2 bacterium RBG_13_44_8b]